jgi:hypothetical protein
VTNRVVAVPAVLLAEGARFDETEETEGRVSQYRCCFELATTTATTRHTMLMRRSPAN